MKLKDQVLDAVNQTEDPRDLSLVYDMLSALKESRGHNARAPRKLSGAARSRKILARWKGSLSDEIIKEREDRL
jgi:RecA-family ATPase